MPLSCVFCELVKHQAWIHETTHFALVWDIAPMRDGHLLILSKPHHESLSELNSIELDELMALQLQLLQVIKATDPSLDVTYILNNGLLKDEGTHFHLHVLPRQPHDGFWEGKPSTFSFPKARFLENLSK